MTRKGIAQGAILVLCVGGCAFGGVFLAGQGLARASLWAGVLALPVAVAGVGVAALAVPRRVAVVPPELRVPEGAVERPEETEQVVAALLGGLDGTVGITTQLYGAGGFGKTTLARIVVADRRVQQHFRGGIYLVTVGRDARGSAIAAKINDVIRRLGGGQAQFTDPELAGAQLGALLESGPPRLLVLDDVWDAGQLAPFTDGGKRCVRLVTTRVPGLVGTRSAAVQVDQMSDDQARRLLTAGLQGVDSVTVSGLLAVTGRWPLLLQLANRILSNAVSVGADAAAEAKLLLERLQAEGPATVDDLLGSGGSGLDIAQPAERAQAVRATIEASTSLLPADDARRLAELGVFFEDRAIPLDLVARLWLATAGMDQMSARQLCVRLNHLGLVSVAPGSGGLSLHDVIREYLRRDLGEEQLAALHATLLAAMAAETTSADSLLTPGQPQDGVAWWHLAAGQPYVRDNLIRHLIQAGRTAEAETVACNLQWAAARIQNSGPAAAAADLALLATPQAARLGAVLARIAHLLAPTTPASAVTDVLCSRIAESPDWAAQAADLQRLRHGPRLVNRWPLPDLPDPAFRRILVGHDSGLTAVAVAPDGTWIASGGTDGTVRVWDSRTGEQRAVLDGNTGPVRALAVAPDGTWLATTGSERTVWMWGSQAGEPRESFDMEAGPVRALAMSPDGTWLILGSSDEILRLPVSTWVRFRTFRPSEEPAEWMPGAGDPECTAVAPDAAWFASGGSDGRVRLWDVETGEQRAVLSGHEGPVRVLAIAPDGTWIASGSSDRTIRIWDSRTGEQRAVLAGHNSPVWAVAVSPDGTWLASGGSFDPQVRIWDPATGRELATRAGHEGGVDAVVVSPDGTWLASGGSDRAVRIWDAPTARDGAVRPGGREGGIDAVAADGGWLASAGSDRVIRTWDGATGIRLAALEGHDRAVHALAIAPDGAWIASGGSDRTIRIWDAVTSTSRLVLPVHSGAVRAIAISPDQQWLAAGGSDGAINIWDASSGRRRAAWAGHEGGVSTIAVAPDGRWLASGGSDETLESGTQLQAGNARCSPVTAARCKQ